MRIRKTPEYEQVTLLKSWGYYVVGKTLDVLFPGDALRRDAVDPARAEALVEHGFAKPGGPEPEEPEEKPAEDGSEEKPKPAKKKRGRPKKQREV